jgi:predicted NAD/FAD-binding protein
MRIAVIGTGIAGLSCAWLLNQRARIIVYEAEARLGGHTNTVSIAWRGQEVPVDTGFIVYNERNYPDLTRLLEHLAVRTHPSDMSFGVSLDGGRLEYAGSSLGGLFAQKRNLLRPAFHRMLFDIQRFNRDAARYLADPLRDEVSLGDFLALRGFGDAFCRHYLLPMGAAIWSASIDGIRAFPATSFLQFFANHGLLSINERPMWRTVTGGARTYVDQLSGSDPAGDAGGGGGAVPRRGRGGRCPRRARTLRPGRARLPRRSGPGDDPGAQPGGALDPWGVPLPNQSRRVAPGCPLDAPAT